MSFTFRSPCTFPSHRLLPTPIKYREPVHSLFDEMASSDSAPQIDLVPTNLANAPIADTLIHPSHRRHSEDSCHTENNDRKVPEKGTDYFKFISNFVRTCEDPLGPDDQISDSTTKEIFKMSNLRAFMNRQLDPKLVWGHRRDLKKLGVAENQFDVMKDAEVVATFGLDANQLTTICYRKEHKELAVVFSGTTGIQYLKHLFAKKKNFYSRRELESRGERMLVHSGFLKLFAKIEPLILQELDDVLNGSKQERFPVDKLSLCGHSLGGVHVYLLLMAILDGSRPLKLETGTTFKLPKALEIRLYTFGCPRLGSKATQIFYRKLLAEYRAKHGEDKFKEYCVRSLHDGKARSFFK